MGLRVGRYKHIMVDHVNGLTIGTTSDAVYVPGTLTVTTLAASAYNGPVGDTRPAGGAFTTLTASGQVTLSPTGTVAISPTSTVAISPTGALTVNPTAASTINNASIGASTPLAGKFTSLTATGAFAHQGTTFGMYNASPIAQRSGSAQTAVTTTAATSTNPYGFTSTQANAIVTLVNELRAWAVAIGGIAGA